MRRERRVPFLVMVVGLVVASPLSWGGGGIRDFNPVRPAGVNDGGRTEVSTKTTLCHRPPGNPDNARTIVVGTAAVAAHLAHGDSLDACTSDCAQECPKECPEASSGVPRTGQTVCWDGAGAPITCAGTGQDGEYQFGASATPRFTDNSDGTVTDNLTKLIWLQDSDCFGPGTWSAGLTASNTLANGECGLTDGSAAGDWRLPNLKEFQSLIDFGSFAPALPAGYPFIGVNSVLYWSSTSTAIDPAFAWYVSLGHGTTSNAGKANPQIHVWPVRGGQ